MTTFTTPKKNNHPACLVYTKLLITLILLLSLTTLQAATYYSRASGNWNTNTTWSLTSGGAAVGSGVYPVAGDVAIIQGGFTVSISANAACATLQVGNSGSGILSFGTTTSITLNTTGNVTVNSGSSITSTTNGNQAHTFTIGGNINCAGTWDMYGNNSTDDINVILNGTFQTISGAGTFGWNSLTVNSGSITTVTSAKSQTVYGNLTINGTLDIGTTTFNRSSSGGTLTVSGKMLLGSNTGGQTGSNFPTNFSTQTLSGGTVVYNYAGAQTVYATPSYTNLTLSGSGIKTITGAKVNGILSMEGTATTTGTPTYGSAATLQYNTATPLTAGSEWVTPFAGTGGVIITNTGAITMNAAKVFNASVPLTINTNASLATNNFQVTFGGNFTNAGTFTAGSSAVVITNTMSAQSISGFTTTGNVSMTKTGGTATLQGNVSATSLIINGTGGTLTLGTGLTHTFSGLITLTAGSLNGGSSTLNENATSTTAWSGTGSLFTAGTGTVNFGGTTQTISATGTTTFTNLTFSNSGVKTISNTVVVNGVLSMEGTATATVSGTLTYGSSATLQYKGSSAQTTGNEFVSPFTGNGGVKINNSNGVTLGSARSVGSNPFTIGNLVSNSLFNDGGFQLTAAGTLNLTSGTYNVKYSSFPAFTITNIATGTTVDYSATASQTVKGITYSNLNISGTGNNSKVSDGNITVNGILNLSSANASATQGCLDMGTNSLNMGAAATTTGTGDVTGIVTRTSFAVNTPYSFGNQFTTLNMAAGGTLPGSVSVKVVLSAAHTWKANSINRYYDIIQTGGSSATLVTINLHYLPGELNGATEGNLDLFDYHVSQTLQVDDHGRSNFSTTDKWVGTTNRPLTYIAPQSAFPSKYWTLGTSTTPSFTWLGANSSDWTDASNWVGNVPGPSDAVVIPDAGTTNYDPSLPASVTIGSINIQAGGILNDGGGSALTITGGVGAWNDLGTFNAGTSTVIFTSASATMANSTNFYNVTVDNGGNLTLGTNNVMRIGGTLSLSSTGVLNAADTHNTVEYNGSNQTVIYPNGSTSGYSYLILSGSGTKTMPASPLNISGDLVMSGTASVTALNALNIAGNVTLGPGTVFAASSFTHTVSGNWTNNGATFTPGTGTITFNGTSAAQSINGTSASQTFNNIIINKASQLLNVGGSTTSLSVNNLTETSGSFTASTTLAINGNVTITAGTFTAGSATSTIMGNATLTAGTYVAGTTTNLLGNWNNNGATLIAGTGAFNFNGSSPQTLGGTTSNAFTNLTVNNTAGITATADQTVNGVLNLPNANASPTQGSLDMGSYTLYMGINATNTGIGDVTGTTTRNHLFATNTIYTFGHPNSRLKFNDVPGEQTFPSSISVNVSVGSDLTWAVTPAQAVKRQFILSHTGGSGNSAIFRASYLDSELASGTNESTLSFWSFVPGANVLTDEGWSNYDVTQNFISVADVDFTYLPNPMYVGLAPTLNTRTWYGGISSDWNKASNWTPNGVPTTDQGVIIPDAATTAFDPSLPVGATCQYVIVESGGILNAVDNATLTLSGGGDVWTAEPAITGLSAGLFNAGNSTVTVTNTKASTTLTGSTNFYNLSIENGVTLRMNTGSYAGISGTLANSGVFDARSNANTIEFKGTGQIIPNPNFTIPGYSNLIIGSSASSLTWPEMLNIGGTFTNNRSGLAETSTVVLDGSSAQTITGTASTTFNNLTINNPFGVTGSTDMTVNGTLAFISDNPSTNDKGALAMATGKLLDMGANSTTTGPGEVSGIIRRTHNFAISAPYSFGNESNTLTFTAVSGTPGQTLPSSVSLKVTIGTAPDWSGRSGAILSNPIKRQYEIIQTGGTGTHALIQVHYKDNEVQAGVSEPDLTIWTSSFIAGTYYNQESGRSGYNTNLEYITIQDVDFADIPSTWGSFQATIAPQSATDYNWTGTFSTDWNNSSNWLPNGVPNTDKGAIIPNTYTTTYAPTLPVTASCKSIQINAGGVLNAPATGGTITITGANASWGVESGGLFNANTSTVLFNADAATIGNVAFIGNTVFYNLTIANGTLVRPSDDSYTGISGTLLNNGTLEASSTENTVEFNGNNSQGILNPNGNTPGYHNLILSGSGTKYLPSTLNIIDQFTNNTAGTGTVVAGTGTVILNGNSYYGQTLGGTSLTTFNNLTIDNPGNIATAATDIAVGGTLNITSGSILDMGTNALSGPISSTIGDSGILKTQNISTTPLPNGTTWTFGVIYNHATIPQTVSPGTYASLQISNPSGTTASGILNSTMLTIDNGATLDMGTFALMGGSTISGTGTLKTQNSTATPIPGGKTWPGSVVYNGSAAQTAIAGTYGNMSIDNAAGVTLTDSATVNGTLLINSGKSLIINPGAKMTAQQIANNAGVTGLTVKSSSSAPNGTLIFNNTSGNPVPATVEMYSKASWDLTNSTPGGKYKWQFFGIPVSTVTASPMFDGDYVRQYNESGKGSGYATTNRWMQLVNSSILTPFTGYEITQPAAKTYYFQGQLINSDFSQALSYTSGADFPGQHLLSNPYTAAIDITKLSFGNDLDKTIYLYNTGSLADWNTQTGTDGNPGQYVSAPQNTAGSGGVPGQIPSMQGFLVMMNTTTPVSTTLGIPYSSVVTRNSDRQRVKAVNNADRIYTRIDVRGSRYTDKMWIFTNPSCSHNFDNGWDGNKFLGSPSAPQIFAMEPDGDYQVNSVDNINNTNIGFLAGEDTNYILKFTHENLNGKYSNLYLIDLQENTTTDITASGTTYSFSAAKTTQPVNRFKIVTNADLTTNASTIGNVDLKIFCSQQTIFVQNSLDCNGQILIYDVSGRIIKTTPMGANCITTIPATFPKGTYLVKGITPAQESTKLIIIP